MINKFLKDCKEILGDDYLSKSGEFIYSATNTLRKGDVYLLGLNPGSSPDDKTHRTIKEDLENFESTTINKIVNPNTRFSARRKTLPAPRPSRGPTEAARSPEIGR